MSDRRPRLLVFVVAYYAESTLSSVLERIPAKVLDDFDCEILVVDDASEDRTFEIGREYQQAHPEIRMTVLRNELQPGLRRQPEGRLHVRDRARVRLRRPGARRRPVRARGAAAAARAAAGGPRRRRVRQPHDDGVRRAARAACRSTSTSATDPHHRPEHAAAHQPQRVPQRLPRLLGAGAAEDPVPAQLERLPLRHRDHHPAAQRRAADRRAADPDLLRRRDLPRQRHEVRQGRDARRRSSNVAHGRACSTSAASIRWTTATATATTTSSSATRAATSTRSTRCPRAAGCSTSGRGPGGMAQELVAEGLRGHGGRPVPGRRTRPATSRSSSRTSTTRRSSTPASTTTCCCST